MSEPRYPPLHERLDEYEEKHFSRIQNCNLFERRLRRWRKYKFEEDATSSSPHDEVIYWGHNDSRRQMLPVRSDETSPTSIETTATISSPSSEFLVQDPNPISAGPITKRNIPDDGNARGWKVKRRGQALQLRLAKHRFLQMAASRQPSFVTQEGEALVSPLSWDSSFFNQSVYTRPERSASWIAGESLSPLPERKVVINSPNGVVWKEISREKVVTAIAMTRLPAKSSFSNPLLLALGDDNGLVVVTRINDDDLFNSSDEASVKVHLDEDALEIPIEGRVRSIDFGDSQCMVVGGDGEPVSYFCGNVVLGFGSCILTSFPHIILSPRLPRMDSASGV
jgi:hypothetical protein